VRYGLSPYVLKRHVLSLKNLPGRGLTKVEKHWSATLMLTDCENTDLRPLTLNTTSTFMILLFLGPGMKSGSQ